MFHNPNYVYIPPRDDRRTATASPLFQRGTAKPGGMYPETNTKSPYKRNPHSCWLRQRYTYPATVVAPLSKGDAAAVTLVIYSLADTNGLQLRVPSSEGYGEAGGYVS